MTPATADELARRLLESPEDAAKLRSGLMEDEWIAQIVSREKQEDAFVESLVTRMWAETSEDHFVKDFTRKLDQIEKSDPSATVPFPGSRTTLMRPGSARATRQTQATSRGMFSCHHRRAST